MMAESTEKTKNTRCEDSVCERRSFGEKCSHMAKKQRAKFYILRRCIAMLVCSGDRNLPKD
ncbi:hypothetical protein ABFS83_12G141900 [Erythranthe nasuta]